MKSMIIIMLSPFIVAYYIIEKLFRIFVWVTRKIFNKKRKRLPSGEYLVVYPDGKEMVELTSKHGPTRYRPNTQELRDRLMENKRQKSILRFIWKR